MTTVTKIAHDKYTLTHTQRLKKKKKRVKVGMGVSSKVAERPVSEVKVVKNHLESSPWQFSGSVRVTEYHLDC